MNKSDNFPRFSGGLFYISRGQSKIDRTGGF